MRKLVYLCLLSLMFSIYGCGPEISTTVQTTGPTVQEVLTYQGPKARIAVGRFTCKAAKCNYEIGEGLADMLATALFRTGRFIVLERGEGLKAIQEELELAQSGYVEAGKGPKIGLMEGADILVMGAITAFEPEASGVLGGGVVIPLPGGVGAVVGKKDAYIAADIRLVDVRTGRVINATRVEGKASSWKVGGMAGGLLGTVVLGGGLSVYKNTPMEKAVMVMLENAIQAISQMVPQSYYRYGEEFPTTPSIQEVQRPSPPQQGPAYEPFVTPKSFVVTGEKVNLRNGPGTNYAVTKTLNRGERLQAIGKQGEWIQVQLPNGQIGWIHSSFIRESP